jgi:cardiolipin synthase
MTIPNVLSIFRLLTTFLFLSFVIKERFNLALFIFVFQGLSDLLDGLIARTFKSKSDLGAFLDPLADKFMLVSSYLVLAYKNIIPRWVTLIVVFRDFFVLLGFLILYNLSYQSVPRPRLLGKICTALEVITIFYVLWSDRGRYQFYFFYLTGLFALLSGLDYLFSGIRLFVRKPLRG